VRHTIGIVTALNPYLGYERTTALAQEAHQTGRGVYDLVLEKGWLSKEQLARILQPERLTAPVAPDRSQR
jgi:aspartate ammonia-lyase